MKARVFLGIVVSVLVSMVALAPASSASTTTETAAVLAHYKALGIDVDHMAPGWKIIDDQIVWQRETEFGVLSTGVGTFCAPGTVCMYSNPDRVGALWFSNDRGRYLDLRAQGWNDLTSSWWNNGSYDARWYYNISGTPNPNVCMNSKTFDPTLTGGQDNVATVVYIYNTATVC